MDAACLAAGEVRKGLAGFLCRRFGSYSCVYTIIWKLCTIASMHRIPPGMDPLAVDLLGAIVPLIKAGQTDVMAATARFELTLSQLRMLFVLDHAQADLAVNELADQVSLSMAAAGRAVDAMVRSGLLSRREDEEDRRVKRIGLTTEGHRTIEQIGTARRQATERFVLSLTEDERAALASAVATLGALTRAHFPGAFANVSSSPSDTSA